MAQPSFVFLGFTGIENTFEFKYPYLHCGNGIASEISRIRQIPDVDVNRMYLLSDDQHIQMAGELLREMGDRFAAIYFEGNLDPADAAFARFTPVYGKSAELCIRQLRALGNAQAQSVSPENDMPGIVERLLQHTLSQRQEVNFLQPGVWNVNAGLQDSFYLVEGRERAVLIDTGSGSAPVRPLVERLTSLPVEVLLTHVHFDHIAHVCEFDHARLSEKDWPLLEAFSSYLPESQRCDASRLLAIEDGEHIDLGGVDIEAIAMPGHTPGSMCFLDHAHRCIFTGDAIGSGIGVLMAIDGALNLSAYLESLKTFRTWIEPYRDYSFYGGHLVQERGRERSRHFYNPLCLALIDDMIELCELLLGGQYVPYEVQTSELYPGEVRYYTHRRAESDSITIKRHPESGASLNCPAV